MEAVEGIQYPYALDKGGSIVKAVDAPRSEIYSCIACKERMVLRRGEIKRPHFAHYTENPNCTPETVLHKMAKDNIREGIETALSCGLKYPFTWHCPVCDQEHKGDLARNTREVKTEVSLDGVRPDILVSSTKGKSLVAIEVVVTHSPEQEAIEAYKQLKLPVLLVEPGWEDLENLKSGLGLVEAWQVLCVAKRCPKCKGQMEEIDIGVFTGRNCYKCGGPLLYIALVKGQIASFINLAPGIIKHARSLGVLMKKINPVIYHLEIAVDQCHACKALQVGHRHEVKYISDLEAGGRKLVKRKPCYRCQACDIWLEKKRAIKPMTAQNPLNIPPGKKGEPNE
ncbi:hypothetical protein ES703_94040 [subsurface metagenome]